MCVLFSTAINNVVWTFEELGYNDDLRASTNVEVAVQKLPQSLLLKWSEHVIVTRINRPNLTTFRDWLQGQADAHDLLPRKIKEEKRNDRKERQRNTRFKTYEETSSSTQPCPLGDGQHAVTDCPVFGKMKPDERAEAATNAQLCFNCLRQWNVASTSARRNITNQFTALNECTMIFSPVNIAQFRRPMNHNDRKSCFKYSP